MPVHLTEQTRQELAVVERFSRSYRDQFARLIEDLNHGPTPPTGRHGLRLCVETVNMLLETQIQLVGAIRALGEPEQTYPRRAAS